MYSITSIVKKKREERLGNRIFLINYIYHCDIYIKNLMVNLLSIIFIEL